MMQLRVAALAAVSMLAFTGGAWAIPSETPHTHRNPTIVDHDTTWILQPPNDAVADPDPDSPDTTMHQHRDRDPLNGGNGKYIGFSVWDNRDYRTGAQYGHGYIEPDKAPRYKFDAAVPVEAQKDFNGAEGKWEKAVNGNEKNVNNVPISISMHYTEVKTGAHEIDVFWRDIGAADKFATAFWDPAATDFTFDSNPTARVDKEAGGPQVSLVGDGTGCADSIQLPWQWFFGGAGAVPNVSVDYFLCNATHDAFTATGKAYDFYTIALHELGHSFALDHFGVGIMRIDISSFVMRDPDAGSVDGLKDHYAIPTPEPATLATLAVALLGLAGLRRRLTAG